LPVSWLWAGRIPLGVLSLLAGRPKLGKSTLAYELAAQLTTGELEGDLAATPGNVLVVTFEDLIAETVVPRLCAAGADLSRGRTIEALEGDQRDLVSLPGDVPRIAEAAAEFDVRLLIVDPLMAALAGGTDSHRDSQVRRVLAPLAKLAEERGLAVLTIMHLNKGQGADLIGRIGGSVAFTGAARSLLVFGADPQDPDGEDGCMRVLAQRGNLAPRARRSRSASRAG
jgi:RecA-family ATPase